MNVQHSTQASSKNAKPASPRVSGGVYAVTARPALWLARARPLGGSGPGAKRLGPGTELWRGRRCASDQP